MSPHVRCDFVSAATFQSASAWAPAHFTGPAAIALRAGAAGSTVSDLGAQLIEGWRASTTPGTDTYDERAARTPVYRQSNIGRLHLDLFEEHWDPPQVTGIWCVQPGDVVLNKQAPIRAALVPSAARRHPVDGNSIIVRGLSQPTAAWLAVCLNQPEYEQLLVAGSIVPRLGLGVLRELRLPPAPPAMDKLSPTLFELLNETVLVGEPLQRAKAEAAAEARAEDPEVNLLAGTRIPAPVMTNDSWLPWNAATRSWQGGLSGSHGWVPLRALAVAAERSRVQSPPEDARVLKLSDVGEDLLALPKPAETMQLARILDKPLITGEVLISTLATSSRTVYADEDVPQHSYPTDSWARLRFRQTPAAWALLLSTPSVRAQLRGLAVGSILQFVPPEALLSVHVPVPDMETCTRWQRVVEHHHARRRALDHRWETLRGELGRTFDEAHSLPEAPR